MGMDPEDELSYNLFYLHLRTIFKKKFDFAVSQCWTICVPCGDSLNEDLVTEEFVDDHILRPLVSSSNEFTSTDEEESSLYRMENDSMVLVKCNNNNESKSEFRAKILTIEKGYNKEFQPYRIIIVDKPLHKKYCKQDRDYPDKSLLNRNISSYVDAVDFLGRLTKGGRLLVEMLPEIDDFVVEIDDKRPLDDLKQAIGELIRNLWARTMRSQTLAIQRDARFQKLLSTALEMMVMHRLHDRVYPACAELCRVKNYAVAEKIDDLVEAGLSLDQLGVDESLRTSISYSLETLVTLSSRKSPLEKLLCLKETLDLTIAEMKGNIAALRSKTDSCDSDSSVINREPDTDDLIPLLVFVIVKSLYQRLHTDFFYIENFTWSVSPNDGLSYTLVTFKAALALLESIDTHKSPGNIDGRKRTVTSESHKVFVEET